MARLIVTARSEDAIANPGNREDNYIVVSVSNKNGAPVTGLDIPNFSVDPMIVGPGGALVDITRVAAGRLAGFYHLDVKPINQETWNSGVYIFAIAVTRSRRKGSTDKGQTLASVLMD